MTRDLALDDMWEALMPLGVDEIRVLTYLANRFFEGSKQYGVLDLQADRRDWTAEAGAEMADALFYLACQELKS